GHLLATTRLIYKAVLETIGIDYITFRLLAVSTVLLSAAFLYALAKRRIGAVPALAPTLVLLFFGSAWQHVVVPIGFVSLLSITGGLASLLALERGDLRGDIAACALISLSIATFTTGFAFLVGVAISVLLRPDRQRRAWIFLIPLTLYAAWWLSQVSTSSAEQQAKPSNVLLIPSYVAESLASVTAGLAGLNFEFADSDSNPLLRDELGWGPVVATLAVVALALRIRRGNLPHSLWVSLGIVLTYWSLGALVASDFYSRAPSNVRYMYEGAVGVLLVATDASRSIRFSRLGLVVLFGACAFSLATNVALMREGAAIFRDEYSRQARAQFAMLELARDHVQPDFFAADAGRDVAPVRGVAASYFATVDRFGSPAFSLPELERQDDSVRQGADQLLARALGVRLDRSIRQPGRGCREIPASERGGAIGFELPRGGASLRAQGVAPGSMMLGRFATSPTVEVGSLFPGETAKLRIPPDSSPRPWRGSVTGVRAVTACALR
ncbi:MAG: hypothetical protein ACRDL1_10785, partial [Solirubrobacterales bacterium]